MSQEKEVTDKITEQNRHKDSRKQLGRAKRQGMVGKWRPSKEQALIYANISRGVIEILREYQLVGEIPKSALRALLAQKTTKASLPPVLPPTKSGNPESQVDAPPIYQMFSQILNSITNEGYEEGAQDVKETKQNLIRHIVQQRELLRSTYLRKRSKKREHKNQNQHSKLCLELKFQARDLATAQMMQSRSIAANFKIKVPQEDTKSNETFKTVRLYIKKQLRLQSVRQVTLFGIQRPSDLFLPQESQIIMKGRLRDAGKLLLVLYQVFDDASLVGDHSSGSEDEDISDQVSSSSEEECLNQDHEKSRDSKAQVAAETDAAEMIANIIALLVIKKQEKIAKARQQELSRDRSKALSKKEKREKQRGKWQAEQQKQSIIPRGFFPNETQSQLLNSLQEPAVKQFSFSEKLREIKNQQGKPQELLQINQDSFLGLLKQDAKQQHSIMSLIGQHYQHDSLKSLSQEEQQFSQHRSSNRPTAGESNKVRSFTQLLRKASSRGSHNTMGAQDADEGAIRPTQVLNSQKEKLTQFTQPSQSGIHWFPQTSINNASIGFQDSNPNFNRPNLFTPQKNAPPRHYQRAFNQDSQFNSIGIQQIPQFMSPTIKDLPHPSKVFKGQEHIIPMAYGAKSNNTFVTNQMMFVNHQNEPSPSQMMMMQQQLLPMKPYGKHK